MGDNSYYKYLFEDDLYLIKEDKAESSTSVVQESVEEYVTPEKETKVEEESTTRAVEEQENSPNPSVPEPWPTKFKGENGKNIAILVHYDNQEIIDSNDESFLLKILSAVNLSLKDVAIINTSKNEALIDQLIMFKCTTCLIFGNSTLTEIQQDYSISEMQGIKFHKANSLEELQKNVSEKKLLWTNLQKLFL